MPRGKKKKCFDTAESGLSLFGSNSANLPSTFTSDSHLLLIKSNFLSVKSQRIKRAVSAAHLKYYITINRHFEKQIHLV